MRERFYSLKYIKPILLACTIAGNERDPSGGNPETIPH
jgi:hypothetical protein